MKIRLMFSVIVILLSSLVSVFANSSADTQYSPRESSYCSLECDDFCSDDCYPLGFYVGGSVDYINLWGTSELHSVQGNVSNEQDFHEDSGSVTFYAGYLSNFCSCDNWLWGVEPYISFLENKHSATRNFQETTISESLKRSFHGGVALRLGYVFPCNVFVYGLIGPDIASFKVNETVDASPDFFRHVNFTKTLTGIMYGLGVETPLFCNRVILGLQATMTNYNSYTITYRIDDQVVGWNKVRPNVFDLALRLTVPLN
jgi:hypothetical protein